MEGSFWLQWSVRWAFGAKQGINYIQDTREAYQIFALEFELTLGLKLMKIKSLLVTNKDSFSIINLIRFRILSGFVYENFFELDFVEWNYIQVCMLLKKCIHIPFHLNGWQKA